VKELESKGAKIVKDNNKHSNSMSYSTEKITYRANVQSCHLLSSMLVSSRYRNSSLHSLDMMLSSMLVSAIPSWAGRQLTSQRRTSRCIPSR